MVIVIETLHLVSRIIFACQFYFWTNELSTLTHSLLPKSRHETAVSMNGLQIWNQHQSLPLSTSNLDRALGVFTEAFRCTINYGQTQLMSLSTLFDI